MRFLSRALLALVALAGICIAIVYAFGPHASVAEAFSRYKQAHIEGNRPGIVALLAPNEIAFMDAQRKLALNASRADVEALPFRQRSIVLSLRNRVLDGELPLQVLQTASPEAFYESAMNVDQVAKTLKPVSIIFAVPTGASTARGYVKLQDVAETGFQDYAIATAMGAYYNFARGEDGTWRVDPTPLLAASAAQNEALAMRVEPTGNQFLLQSIMQVSNPERAARLWDPLVN